MTMTQDTRDFLVALAVAAGIVLLVLFMFGIRKINAQALDPAMCPQGAPSCKVITITPEEYKTLDGPDMVWDQASWARQQLGPLVKAWREKIDKSPAGKPYSESTLPPAPK